MTSFICWALSLLPSPPPVFVAPQTPQGMAWCSGKLCDTYREYDVIPGIEATKAHGSVRPFTVCMFCGDQMDVDLPEPEEAA